MRRYSGARSVFVALILGMIAQTFVFGQDQKEEPPSCSKTTARVLAPYIKYVLNAQKGLVEYEKKLSLKRQKHVDWIQIYEDAKHELELKRKLEIIEYDRRIELAGNAIRKLGILGLKTTGIDGLSGRFDKNGWQLYIADVREKKAERMEAYNQKKVSKHFQTIGYSMSRLGLEKAIKKQQDSIVSCDRREPSFHLTPIGYSMTGPGIDKKLKTTTESLEDAKSRIQAGTYTLHVPAYGYTVSRNKVLKDLQTAEEKLEKTRKAWGLKEFAIHNSKIGYTVTNAKIEKFIEDLKAKKKGDATVIHVPELGYSMSATGIRERIAKAQKESNQKNVKYWSEKLAAWKKAYAKFVGAVNKKIQAKKEALEYHRELWEKELERQQAYIDDKLMLALKQTPCGSAAILQPDAQIETIDKHRAQLSQIGPDKNENEESVETYNDRVYVDSTGRVHGDPADAWSDATGIPRKDDPRNPANSDSGKSMAEQFMELKSTVDYLAAFVTGAEEATKDLPEWTEFLTAKNKLDGFMKELESLPSAGNEMVKMRRKLKFKFDREIASMFKTGALSPNNIDALMNLKLEPLLEAIRKTGGNANATRDLKNRLESLKDLSQSNFTSRLKSAFSGSINEAIQPGFGKAIGEAQEVIDEVSAGKKIFDRVMLTLGVMNAVADAYDRTSKGVPTSEAIARSASNLALEIALGDMPLLAAADAASKIILISYAHATGQPEYANASLEDVSKMALQMALDKVAATSQWAGEWYEDAPTQQAIMDNVAESQLVRALNDVERQLDIVPPGHEEEQRLMRIRSSIRKLLRAKRNLKK